LGCNPQWLYDLLPNGAAGYHPYDATHVITQIEILLFSALAFTLLNLWGKYPPELPSVNLDADWIYRKVGRGFLSFGEGFWNGLNKRAHTFFVEGITGSVCSFLKRGHVHAMQTLYQPFVKIGLIEENGSKGRDLLEKRSALGVHPVGWTALFCMLFFLGFLLLMFK